MKTDSTIVSGRFQKLLNNKITALTLDKYYNAPLVKKVKG